jgi:hypothetical protein
MSRSLSKKTRFAVFHRDGFCCQYCGRRPPDVVLEADHVVPVADDGPDDLDNLVTSCFDCNRGKSDTSLDEPPPTVAERMAARQELADQLEAYNAFLMSLRKKEDAAIERVGLYWFNQYMPEKDAYVFGQDRVASVRTFLRRMPEAEILDAVQIAFSRKPPYGERDTTTFRYFCGVCWKKIRDAE